MLDRGLSLSGRSLSGWSLFSPLRSTKSLKKLDENIGHHPKKEKIGTPKVFQRLYVFHLYAQRNHSLTYAHIYIELEI